MSAPIKILFVCTGNICRSPTAEGVARSMAKQLKLAARFEFDSAATHTYHTGEAPDRRTVAAARKRGIDLSGLRARPLIASDYEHFDLLLAMDEGHLQWMRRQCPTELQAKLKLFLDFSPQHGGADVPDPYYGGEAGFEHVLDLVEDAVAGLIHSLN